MILHPLKPDARERLRGEGRLEEARKAAELSLKASPRDQRTTLFLAEIYYLEKNYQRSLDLLDSAASQGVSGEGLKALREGVIRLHNLEGPSDHPSFTTESMAELLARQGHAWDALRIYRKLYLQTPSKDALWQRILFLREQLDKPGTDHPQVAADEIALLDRWIEKQRSRL